MDMNYRKFVNLFVLFLLINSSLLVIYSVFFPNSTFLFFKQTYLAVISIADTGGNGHLNLLMYPLSLYFFYLFIVSISKNKKFKIYRHNDYVSFLFCFCKNFFNNF